LNKKLIINADDFGWDQDTVEGILNLSALGNITSTSVMITHAKEKDIRELKKIKKVSKGLHLNLIDGQPLSPQKEVKSLTNSEGNFFPAPELMKRFLLRKIKLEELEMEIKNQISSMRQLGIEISHVDSHQHVHLFPFLGNFILPVLKKSGVKRVRTIRNNSWNDRRRMVIQLFSMYPNNSLKSFKHPQILLCDFSVKKDVNDQVFDSAMIKAFKKNQLVELMTHPALTDRPDSYLKRKSEYDYLAGESWKESLEQNGIQLLSYDMI
jgi:predicted glycoside hydrolase/deacetylase ChbG (UPF0249 family)